MTGAAVMTSDDDLAAADTGCWPDDNTTIGDAADPTAAIPQPPQATPALAWADDCDDEPATQSVQAADVPATWGATINYAVFLIVCGLIAAATTAAFAWLGVTQP